MGFVAGMRLRGGWIYASKELAGARMNGVRGFVHTHISRYGPYDLSGVIDDGYLAVVERLRGDAGRSAVFG